MRVFRTAILEETRDKPGIQESAGIRRIRMTHLPHGSTVKLKHYVVKYFFALKAERMLQLESESCGRREVGEI